MITFSEMHNQFYWIMSYFSQDMAESNIDYLFFIIFNPCVSINDGGGGGGFISPISPLG